jgi:2-iminobutanoate/2-iminopropanoate deaminase
LARQEIRTSTAPAPSGSYSQGIVAGPFVFTAGVGPHRPDDGQVAGRSIEDQTMQALKNVEAVLGATGLGSDDVVKVCAHLAHLERDFAGYDRVYREFFRLPWPARTTVGSQLGGILIEVDVVALRS